jgi:hypothetical protein
MRIRTLHLVRSLFAHTRMYRKKFTKRGYINTEIIVHGIILEFYQIKQHEDRVSY